MADRADQGNRERKRGNVFPERLMIGIRRSGMTAETVAEKLGISRSRIYRLMNTAKPKVGELVDLCRLLNVSLDWLIRPEGILMDVQDSDAVEIGALGKKVMERGCLREMVDVSDGLSDYDLDGVVAFMVALRVRRESSTASKGVAEAGAVYGKG